MNTATQGLDLLTTPRTPHLRKIWADLTAEARVPQLDRWLNLRLKQDKRFGSKDRRFYADAIFAVMRQALELPNLSDCQPDEAWERLRLMPGDEVFAAVEALHAAPADERRGGLSPWFDPFLAERAAASKWTDEQRQRFVKGQLERAPLWLRLNHQKDRGRAESLLRDLDTPFEVHGDAYLILREKNLSATPLLADGLMEVQDYGSQMLGHSLPIKAGDCVWDACAGGGGKSLQMASLHPKARIFASDVRSYKSAEVLKRAKRARLSNVSTISWDGSSAFERPSAAKNGFDLILVDAPCSGSGTFRRSPDGRFRLSRQSIQDLHDLQFRIGKTVAPHLKRGGTLVYATCSWFVEENEAVTERIQRELGLTLVEQGLKGLPAEDADSLFVAHLKSQV